MGSARTKHERIDFASIADRADLEALIVADLGEPDRVRKWLCPFHDDHNPSLGLTNNGRTFRCWACGAKGDALSWLTLRGHAANVVEAAKILDPTIEAGNAAGSVSTRRPSAPTPVRSTPPRRQGEDRPPVWQDPEWQAEVDRVVCEAQALLWSPEGRAALDWLRKRGFEDWTISKFRLGFLPDWWTSAPIGAIPPKGDKPGRIALPRRVVIPWCAPLSWYGDVHHRDQPPHRWAGVNVRRLNPDVSEPWTGGNKYAAAKLSPRGYGFPFADELTPGVNVLIAEGEFDALLAQQSIGHMASVVTAGGASQPPDPALVLEMQQRCPTWLIATDADAAGKQAEDRWRAIGRSRCRRLLLPPGRKDLGDMAQAQDDIPAWFASECRRLGLTQPAPKM